MARNTYKQDERLDEPFNFKHLLRASVYLKKYAAKMIFALCISALGGAIGLIAPKINQQALDVAIPERNTRLLIMLAIGLVGTVVVSIILTTIRSRIMIKVSQRL